MRRTRQGTAASWEELPQLDRTHNRMGDVEGFLRRWDGLAPKRHGTSVLTSDLGNRNRDGRPGRPVAWAVAPGEEITLNGARGNWLDALEDGVRQLVPAVVRRFGCVTYSSCEGHDYTGLGEPNSCREVCVVARDAGESDHLTREMTSVMGGFYLPQTPAVSVAVAREYLGSRTDDSLWRGITLRLGRTDGSSWAEYFAQVDRATEAVTELVDRSTSGT